MSTMSAGVYAAQTSSNAILYNLSRDSTRNNWGKLIEGMLSNHGAYGMMSLWEGNVIETFLDDGYHGSCGYQTIFRNQIHGVHARGYTENRKMVGLSRGAYYYNVIGNVIGDSTWNPAAYDMTGEPDYTYRLAHASMLWDTRMDGTTVLRQSTLGRQATGCRIPTRK